ncbi:XRE family transcriptional regulator [Planosporangium sp. 12N6]|uniref:XRE family transcriptional regulator n=1 Tax=Planosporangium spinosum TaxID=3402278 RepID=UPI003CFB3DF7
MGLLGYAGIDGNRDEVPVRHPLARALNGIGMDATDVAARLGVDPKTVQRWMGGRVPYPRHRAALVALTGWEERDLWPAAAWSASPDPGGQEIVLTYPHRSAVPVDAWRHLFERAEREVGILAYSALFLAEDVAVQRLLRDKARAGVRVRIALGDAEGEHVTRRGVDEGIDQVVAARIRNAILLFRPLADERNVQLRLHDTVLYNSFYRADDALIVNTHVYGCPASYAPVFHLRRRYDDGAAAIYLDSFERAWRTAYEPRPECRAHESS